MGGLESGGGVSRPSATGIAFSTGMEIGSAISTGTCEAAFSSVRSCWMLILQSGQDFAGLGDGFCGAFC